MQDGHHMTTSRGEKRSKSRIVPSLMPRAAAVSPCVWCTIPQQ